MGRADKREERLKEARMSEEKNKNNLREEQ